MTWLVMRIDMGGFARKVELPVRDRSDLYEHLVEIKKMGDEDFKQMVNDYIKDMEETEGEDVFVYAYTDDFFMAEEYHNITTLLTIAYRIE